MTRILSTLLIAAALLLAGCGSKQPPPDVKRYPMQGTVKSLDATHKTAMIDAGKIGDWMEPMTMEYPIKPDSEFQKLHVGDKIEATVVVGDPGYYVTDVKVK
jgi:Cu/Ag efflux protein CusF